MVRRATRLVATDLVVLVVDDEVPLLNDVSLWYCAAGSCMNADREGLSNIYTALEKALDCFRNSCATLRECSYRHYPSHSDGPQLAENAVYYFTGQIDGLSNPAPSVPVECTNIHIRYSPVSMYD